MQQTYGSGVGSPAFRKTERLFIEKTLLQMYPRLQYRDLHPWKLVSGPLIPDVIVHNIPANVRRIVEVGCGDGVLANTLSLLYPEIEIIGVDADPNKIFRARQTIGTRKNLKFACGNAAVMSPIPCDLIIYNGCLTWYENPQDYKTMVAKTLRWLQPGGEWIMKESPLKLAMTPTFWKFAHREVRQTRSIESYLQGLIADLGYEFPSAFSFSRLPWMATEVYYRLPRDVERNLYPTGPRRTEVQEWHDPVQHEDSDEVLGFLFSNSMDGLLQELR